MTTPIITFKPGAEGVPVDLDRLISSRLLLQANSGGGKSRALRYLLEQTHGRVPQIVLDPEGEFASLRERFDYVLAGRDGDIPAHPKTAKVLCRRVMELGASAVIDLYDLTLEERRRFVKLFLEELMHLPRALWRPTLVAIDEAHVFAPEQGQSESLAAVVALCTQGRKRGYAALLATQRLSKLHKDAAAELLNKMIGRTGLDVDVKRAGDELGFDKEQRQGLKFLTPGTFYVYGPAIANEVMQIRTGDVVTTHPEPGQIVPPAPPAPRKVQALIGQMQELQREADEELRTIEEHQAKIKRLEKELRAAQRGAPAAAVADPTVVQKAVDRALATAEREHTRELAGIRKEIAAHDAKLARWLRPVHEAAGKLFAAIEAFPPPLELPDSAGNGATASGEIRTSPAVSGEVRKTPAPAVRERASEPPSVEGLTPSQARILAAIATLEALGVEAPTRPSIGALSNYRSTSGGTFAKNVAVLVDAGLVEIPAAGQCRLTYEGSAAAPPPEPIDSLEELHAKWLSLLSDAEQRILAALIEAYPEPLDRPTLGERTGYTSTSGGTFAKNVARLVEMRAAEIPRTGVVQASSLLFPEGLS